MKLLLSIILLFTGSLYCKSQNANPKEIERRDKLVSDCNCPNQFINTDSVYSFINSYPWKPFQEGYGIFVIQDKPTPFKILFDESAREYFFEYLRAHYEDEVPFQRTEIIPPKVFRKMLSITFDSTTLQTEPIIKWNVARMGEKWINRSNYNYIRDLTLNNIKNKKEKKNEEAADIFYNTIARSVTSFELSVPVFDDDYKYAFVVGRFKGEKNYCFALFKRDESGWTPLLVSKGERTREISNEF